MTENGNAAGRLTSQGVTVSNLVFRHVPGARSSLVKIEADFTATKGSRSKTKSFFLSAVLRDSY